MKSALLTDQHGSAEEFLLSYKYKYTFYLLLRTFTWHVVNKSSGEGESNELGLYTFFVFLTDLTLKNLISMNNNIYVHTKYTIHSLC